MTHAPPPAATTTQATRTMLATVDTPRTDLEAVLEQGWHATTPAALGTLIEDLVDDALHDRSREAAKTLPIENPATFLLGIALAAIRVERATPFQDASDTYNRRTTDAVDKPLQANPGSSAVFQALRDLYQRALLAVFDAHDDSTRFVARILLSPTETTATIRGETTESMIGSISLVTDAETDYVALPAAAATQWCRIKPIHRECATPALTRRPETDDVLVPVALLRAKFAAYTTYGFERLVHRAFHGFRDARYATVRAESWRVEKQLHDTYVRNATQRIYGDRRYDTTSNTTPPGPQRTGFTPVTHHPQLAAIVDVIRATPSLSFNDYHTARDIYEHAQTYYPPPHRVPNTLWSIPRIAGVLSSAAAADGGTNDVVESRDHPRADGPATEYRITAPRPTPLYTRPPDATHQHRWTAYRKIRTRHATESLPRDTEISAGTRRAAGTTDDPLVTATTATHRFTANHPHERPLEKIGPAVHPDDFDADYDVPITADTLTFLTRIIAGLNGLIEGESLRDGMQHYLEDGDRHLDVDPDRLAAAGVIDIHKAGYFTIYTVARDVVDALDRAYVTHEDYGDATPAEKGKHKYGAVLLAAGLAARDDVATVVRYARLWRFNLDVDGDALQARLDTADRDVTVTDLDQRRLDVAALDSDGRLVCAGEVQLDHGDPPGVRRNWAKLRYVGAAGVETVWLMPDLDALANIIDDLRATDCLHADALPGTDRVAHWQSFFTANDLFNPGIANFSTYRSLYRGVVEL